MEQVKQNIYCKCGCGGIVTLGKTYIIGHNRRGAKNTTKHNLAISKANSGSNNPACQQWVRDKISKSLTGKKQTMETKMKRIKSLTNNPKVIARGNNGGNRGSYTSPQGLANLSAFNKQRCGVPLTEKHRNAIRQGLLKHFANKENRIKRAKQISNRVQKEGYKYKNGYITLPNLNITLFYRSSYEKTGLLLLDRFATTIQNICTECIHIPYQDSKGTLRIYTPDWLVTLKTGLKLLIEVKPTRFINKLSVVRKSLSAIDWCKENNSVYCIWTEDILFNISSTTMSLREIVEATVTTPSGLRYSLNFAEMQRKEQK